MARYRMEGDTIVDTEKASKSWNEATFWNGNNHISSATNTQWTHETLYCSRRGRYYVVYSSDWQGSVDHAEWVSPQEAARWLLLNEHPIPESLTAIAEEVTE